MPILDEHINTPRIGLGEPFQRPHPLTAVRLTSHSPNSLPAGVITVYDTTAPPPSPETLGLAACPPVQPFDIGVDLGAGRARIDRGIDAVSIELQ